MKKYASAYRHAKALDKDFDDLATAEAAGRAIVAILELKELPGSDTRRPGPRYDTAYGNKTPAGLARTIVQEMKLALQEAR